MLKFVTETVHRVEYSNLEKFVNAHYKPKQQWDFVSDQECGNDSSHSFTVVNETDEFEKEDLIDFVKGKRVSGMAHAILNDLCSKDLIPAGKYIVNVCW
jgi:hypothetical protein